MICEKCGRELPADGSPCECERENGEEKRESTPVENGENTARAEAPDKSEAPAPKVAPSETAAPEAQQTATTAAEEPEQESRSPESPLIEAPILEEPAVLPSETAPTEIPQQEMTAPKEPQVERGSSESLPIEAPVPEGPAPENRPPSPAQEALRALAGSTIFLLAAVFSTLAAVLSCVRVFVGDPPLFSMLPDGDLLERLTHVRVDGTVLALLVAVPLPLLVIVALWMIYATGKRRNSARFGTAGLTLLRIPTVVAMVVVSVLPTFVLSVLFAALLQSIGQIDWAAVFALGPDGMLRSFVGSGDAGLFVFGAAILLSAGILWGFLLLVCARVLASLTAARRMAVSGIARRKASALLGVVCLLRFAAELIDVYGQFVLNGPISAAATVCSAAGSLCFAVVIFRFNAIVRRFHPKEALRQA